MGGTQMSPCPTDHHHLPRSVAFARGVDSSLRSTLVALDLMAQLLTSSFSCVGRRVATSSLKTIHNHHRSAFNGKALRSPSLVRRAAERGRLFVDANCKDHPPQVGNVAPDFTAQAVFDQEFVETTLKQYRGKYVVLFFYPLDFTFVCPTEITAFSDRYSEFSALNAEVLGVSVDSQFSHLAWIQTDRKEGGLGDLAYPLVADLTKEISSSYQVLTEEGVALRGLFIIDKEGIVQHATINNLAFGRSVDETLRTLQAIQYVQENPDEVCPAGWKPGDKTMKPTPKESKEFFAAV